MPCPSPPTSLDCGGLLVLSGVAGPTLFLLSVGAQHAAPTQPSDFSQRSGKFQFMASPFVFATHPQISRVTRLLATLPKTHPCKSFVCHTCDTPRGCVRPLWEPRRTLRLCVIFPQRHSFTPSASRGVTRHCFRPIWRLLFFPYQAQTVGHENPKTV